MVLVGGIRYALWSWVPYFLENGYHLGDSRSALFSIARRGLDVVFAMLFGKGI